MRAWSRLIVFTAVLALLPAPAIGDLLYDLEWTRVDEFRTLVRVDRVNPDGSITPFDEVRSSEQHGGTGLLRLTPDPTFVEPTHTWYDASLDGVFLAFAGLGAAPLLLPTCVNDFHGCIGQLSVAGDPAAPSSMSLGILDFPSPHCQFDCVSHTFNGFGVLALAAPEPAAVWFTALGLAGAIFAARRR